MKNGKEPMTLAGLRARISRRAASLWADASRRMSRCWWPPRDGRRPGCGGTACVWCRIDMLRTARYGETQADCVPQTAEERAWLGGLTEGEFRRMLAAWGDNDLRIGIGQWISSGY